MGARNALYRTGMQLAGSFSITMAGWWGWPAVNVLLACLYLPMLLVTLKAPEPAGVAVAAPHDLKEAVWYPFLGFLSRHRALEILAFVLLYKLADNLVPGAPAAVPGRQGVQRFRPRRSCCSGSASSATSWAP